MTKRAAPKPEPLEIELKFELTRRDVRSLCQAAPFRAMQSGPQKRKTMRATYYDTPDLKLAARGVALRVRKESRAYVQCVKAKAGHTDAGGFARREWEWDLPGPTPDLSLLRGDDRVKALLKGVNLQKLEPIFSTDIRRQSRTLLTPGGAQVKCDIDQGRILSGEREAPIYELELELASGGMDELMELGHLVTELVPARLSQRSKAYRGYTLYRGQGHTWERARPLDLPKRPTAEDVLMGSVLEGLRHLIGNEDCVLTRCDIEGVHQMRVAMRRMRAAITTYKTLLPEGTYEGLADGLQAAGSALGPARDWDVFRDEILPPVMTAFENAPELVTLAQAADQRRDAGYKAAQNLIKSADYARLLTGVLYWAGRKPWRTEDGQLTDKALGAPARQVASEVLKQRHTKMLKAGKGLADLHIEDRHKLRIAGKKARYAAEFFAPLYPDKKTKPYIKALRALQNGLGHLNDLANAQAMMAELMAAARGPKAKQMARAAGMVEGWYTHAQFAREAELLKAWEAFRKAKPFW